MLRWMKLEGVGRRDKVLDSSWCTICPVRWISRDHDYSNPTTASTAAKSASTDGVDCLLAAPV